MKAMPKRLLGTLLTLCMMLTLFSVLSFTALAATADDLKLNVVALPANVKPGDDVTITVSLANYDDLGIPDISGLGIEVNIDPAYFEFKAGSVDYSYMPTSPAPANNFAGLNTFGGSYKVALTYLGGFSGGGFNALDRSVTTLFTFQVTALSTLTDDSQVSFSVTSFSSNSAGVSTTIPSGGIDGPAPSVNVLVENPVILFNGAAPTGADYTGNVTVTFNKGDGVISKNGGAPAPITSGTAVTENGSYTVTVTDAMLNETIVNFTINKPASTTTTTTTSSGGSAADTAIGPPAPSTMWLEKDPAATLAGESKKLDKEFARTKSTGIYGVRGDAWGKLAGLRYEHDTMDGKAVEVRVYINNPEKFMKDTLVSGHVKSGNKAAEVKAIFEKWFKNKVRVIHLDQKGDWAEPVKIAAGVDLTGMDTRNLFFYSYDKAANTYKRIEASAYWIDANGYLRFTTPYAGDIIVSEGLLERK